MLSRRAQAEFIGTFVLVFGGVGSAVVAGEAIGALGVAFAFGLSLLAMAYAIGPISGCHINPAVTLGLLIARKIDRPTAVEYWVAQVLGGLAATIVLLLLVKGQAGGYNAGAEGLGANGFGDNSPEGYNLGSVLLTEVILTALLVFTVLSSTDRIANVAFAGIPIGLVLTLIHLVGIPIDNTSVNPARSIGPALFGLDGAIGQLWLFILAPLLGGVFGAGVHQTLFSGGEPIEPEASAVASEAGPPL